MSAVPPAVVSATQRPCLYVCAQGKMCRKCGQVHSEPIFQPATTPMLETDALILKMARGHGTAYTNRHYPDSPAFSFPMSKLLAFARAYGAAVESAAVDRCIAAVLSAPVKTDRQDQREACAAAIRALKGTPNDNTAA